MRYEKELYAPEERFVVEHVDPSHLREGQAAALFHMRQTENGTVAAEGWETAFTLPSSAAPSRIYTAGRDVYVYGSGTKALYGLTSGISATGIQTEPVTVLSHFTDAGAEGVYCLEENAVRYIYANVVRHTDRFGGTCAAMHHGRLFTAKGYRLTFSAPHSQEGLSQTENDPDKACYLDFDKERGEIAALVSFRERLYVFFRHGIVRLSAEGEAVDFTATAMPFAGEEIVAGSVISCGDRICYLTERGLWSFDGSKNTFLDRRREIDISAPVRAYDFKGRYAAAVTQLGEGQTVVYVYDFIQKAGRFLSVNGLVGAAGEYFLEGNKVYRFTETGATGECSLRLNFCTPLRALAWVRVTGFGEFEIRTNVTEGTLKTRAGQKLRINAAEKNEETQIDIIARDPFRIFSVDVAWRLNYAD